MNAQKPRYLFCINSGRSGSQYLARLMATDARIAAYHEAPPEMTGDALRLIEQKTYPETYAARLHKADACRELLMGQPHKQLYVETNHMFIKTFFDVVLRELAPVGVIVLRRELARIVKSFAELGIFTERNDVWSDWMPRADARTRAIDPAPGSLDSLERAVAYLVDLEARTQRFLQEYPGTAVFETRLEAIGGNCAEVQRLFEWTGGGASEETIASLGTPVNERQRRKQVIGATVTYEQCVEAVIRYLERCKDAGIIVPDTLALRPLET